MAQFEVQSSTEMGLSLGRSNGRPSLSRQARWAERGATLAIFLMARPIGHSDLFKQYCRIRTGGPVRMDGFQNKAAEPRRRWKKMIG